MIKQGKTIIIGLSSILAVGVVTTLVSFPDEKLTTDALQNSSSNNVTLAKVQPGNTEKITPVVKPTSLRKTTSEKIANVKHRILSPKKRELIDKIIKTGLSRIGTPYIFGGTTEKGFDCSGFVHYAFRKFKIEVPRSSKQLAETGKPVKLKETRKGDILIFTGTNVSDRTPGHVGIVISKAGEPIKFVHSSSNGGVKISKVEGTNYERRFLETRRVL